MRSAQSLLARIVASLAPAVLTSPAPAQPCQPRWEIQPAPALLHTSISAFAALGAGTNQQLFAAGHFTGLINGNGVARWNGSSWTPVGTEMNSYVKALAIFDDGAGSALYAAGEFTTAGGSPAHLVAKWTGTRWIALGDGLGLGAGTQYVSVLASFEDDTGSGLYAGGVFNGADGLPVNSLARWDGHAWTDAGGGVLRDGAGRGSVDALRVFDDGSGPALFVGGDFDRAGTIPANGIAKWDGHVWSALGSGLAGGVPPYILPGASSLRGFDDGSGPALYVGGFFDHAGGIQAVNIAKWNGSAWSPVGTGVGARGPDRATTSVSCLSAFGAGSERALFVGGTFSTMDGIPAPALARWDGLHWTPAGQGMGGSPPSVRALVPFNDAEGPALAVAGGFPNIGNMVVNGAARWNGSSWRYMGFAPGVQNVCAMQVFNSGSGPALYAAGSFLGADGILANNLARWDADHWSPVAGGVTAPQGSYAAAYALEVLEDTAAPKLFVGGSFTAAGGAPAANLATWDGESWAPVGGGVSPTGSVRALRMFNDGRGPALYVAGDFQSAGGVPVSNIARWDGASWSPLGAGLDRGVNALGVFDDGAGPALFAAGVFTTAGGVPASCIARWDGRNWSALLSGLQLGDAAGYALCPFDDHHTQGPRLFVGGRFQTAGGLSIQNIATWDGAAWAPVDFGTSGGWVEALAAFDDGRSLSLFAGGNFTHAGHPAAPGIARWDGLTWSPLDRTVGGDIACLATFPLSLSQRPSLWAGGTISRPPGARNAPGIAQWVPLGCCPDMNRDGAVNIADFFSFLALYYLGDPLGGADFNADGRITIADFTAFLAAFAAGC